MRRGNDDRQLAFGGEDEGVGGLRETLGIGFPIKKQNGGY
jgi:hypothetical protein